ncbi:hypothetical protein [Streptomyces hainanensis]|uniref:Chaplin n=1 Tax=Streptomyces hainanensis TaxID=402648 RepID=A0A4R4SYY3_9ACTN|nr:hypothetical protein [Streptomyces hainanensis]TDC67399.1 hypothetical protein E1283_28970 [Streptomyces hainanensis]
MRSFRTAVAAAALAIAGLAGTATTALAGDINIEYEQNIPVCSPQSDVAVVGLTIPIVTPETVRACGSN